MRIAITRQVSPAIGNCELTHFERLPIDIERAQTQHRAYERCLTELGCQVISLPAEPALPDSVFVEDCAVVLDELALITRPGAESRRPETESIAQALAPYRQLHTIRKPATLDGGDVLRLGRTLYVGMSGRSNPAAVDQMRALLAPHGYTVIGVPLKGCLHLKSAVTQVSSEAVLLNPNWVDPATFTGTPMSIIEIDPSEPYAANAVWIDSSVIYPANFPATLERLRGRGIQTYVVDVSELQKAEGAVTCCSLIFRESNANQPPSDARCTCGREEATSSDADGHIHQVRNGLRS